MGARVSQELSPHELSHELLPRHTASYHPHTPLDTTKITEGLIEEKRRLEQGEIDRMENFKFPDEGKFKINPPILVIDMHGRYERINRNDLFQPPFPIIKINSARLGTLNITSENIDTLYRELYNMSFIRDETSGSFANRVRVIAEANDSIRSYPNKIQSRRSKTLNAKRIDSRTKNGSWYMNPSVGDYIRDSRSPYKMYTASTDGKTMLNKLYIHKDNNSVNLIYDGQEYDLFFSVWYNKLEKLSKTKGLSDRREIEKLLSHVNASAYREGELKHIYKKSRPLIGEVTFKDIVEFIKAYIMESPNIPLIVLDITCSRISNIDPENDMAPAEFDAISGLAAGMKTKTKKKPKTKKRPKTKKM